MIASTTFCHVLPLVVVAAAMSGCAAVPREAGFADVEALAADRGIARIHWNQGTASDEAVAASVRQMLVRELAADDAVQVALLNNPALQATYEDLAVAQADLVQAGLLTNPVFDGAFRFREGGGDVSFEGSLLTGFIDLFLIPLRTRAAGAAFEAAKLRVTGEILDLTGRTRAAFYEVQAGRQLLDMRRTVVATLGVSADVADRLREAGNITALDHAAQRAQYEQSRVDLAAADAAYLAARERLSALMGVWGREVNWTLADRLPDPPAQEPPLDDAETRAVARSLTLGAHRQELVAAAQRAGLSHPLATLLAGEAGISAEHSPEEGWGVGPAVQLPIPLFDQGLAKLALAQAGVRRARQLYAARAIETRAAARAAAIQLRGARERVDHYRRAILPLQQTIVEQSQLQYNAMQIGVAQLLQARREQIEAGARYVQALRDYWLARADLEQVTNGHLPRLGRPARDAMGGESTAGPAGGGGGH